MYCSNCGAEGSGNFCSECGARLATASGLPVNVYRRDEDMPQPELPATDWRYEARYDALLENPEVRQRITQHAALARQGMTGEQFLEIADKVLAPITLVPMSATMSIAMPIYKKLGIKTGKTRSELLPHPVGSVLVGILCSLARFGREITNVQQGVDGCVLEAKIPSDLRSLSGELVVTVLKEGAGTRVEAATQIHGQLFDWGKSNQCLEQTFTDLRMMAA